MLLTGCALSAEQSRISWAQRQGPEITDERLQRVKLAGQMLGAQGAGLTYHVLQNGSVTAYSWPSGDVYVSSGLIDRASDAEIAAAIAHELGHLMKELPKPAAAGLGGPSALQVEMEADAYGASILQKQGLKDSLLISLLQKVADATASSQCRGDIAERIHTLEASAGR